jgi:hypothetical protein
VVICSLQADNADASSKHWRCSLAEEVVSAPAILAFKIEPKMKFMPAASTRYF